MYRIIRDLGGNAVAIRPPLREATPAVFGGYPTLIDMNTPGVVMRMTNAREFIAAVRSASRGTAKAAFQEAFDDA
jgi:hypothetical protein